MKFILVALLLATGAQAQDADLALVPSAELLAELQYLNAQSENVDVRGPILDAIEKALVALAICEGMTVEDSNRSFTPVAALIAAYTGSMPDISLEEQSYRVRSEKGCSFFDADVRVAAETLEAIGRQLSVRKAVSVRIAELNRRLLAGDELANLADELAKGIRSRAALSER